MLRYLIPLGIFVILVIFLAIGLQNDPRYVPSPLIGKPAPDFTLPRLFSPNTSFGPNQLKGKVWILNTWTSDCVGCRQEHPYLLELSKNKQINLIGLNYRDSNILAINLLKRHGNPYQVVVTDLDGSVGIDYGVYAVPETFIIDKKGIIRFKYIGPLFPDEINKTILPLIKKLNGEMG
jgi:cytochrome c biogenesis protein CcmG, thiol:disulfide interchange protein DsbE